VIHLPKKARDAGQWDKPSVRFQRQHLGYHQNWYWKAVWTRRRLGDSRKLAQQPPI
jgi:hypothetical protein